MSCVKKRPVARVIGLCVLCVGSIVSAVAACSSPGCAKKCAPMAVLVLSSTQYRTYSPVMHINSYCANIDLIEPGIPINLVPATVSDYVNGATTRTCPQDLTYGPGGGSGGNNV